MLWDGLWDYGFLHLLWNEINDQIKSSNVVKPINLRNTKSKEQMVFGWPLVHIILHAINMH